MRSLKSSYNRYIYARTYFMMHGQHARSSETRIFTDLDLKPTSPTVTTPPPMTGTTASPSRREPRELRERVPAGLADAPTSGASATIESFAPATASGPVDSWTLGGVVDAIVGQ